MALCFHQIFILNEETVVAACFVSFVLFSFSHLAKASSEIFAERKENLTETILESIESLKFYCAEKVAERLHKSHVEKQFPLLRRLLIYRILFTATKNDIYLQNLNDFKSQTNEYQNLRMKESIAKASSSILLSLYFQKTLYESLKKSR